MNSLGDLLAAEVPFVCPPMDADQPAFASRALELGDHATATAEQLADAVDRVAAEPALRSSIRVIAESLRAAGEYAKAVDEVFALKKRRGIA